MLINVSGLLLSYNKPPSTQSLNTADNGRLSTITEHTGYSSLPSLPRLMRHAVDTWYKWLGRHKHTQRDAERHNEFPC